MGAGIVEVLLRAGVAVHLVERDQASADQAEIRLEHQLRRSLGDDAEATEALARLIVGTTLTAEAAPGLVVESVPESFDLKAQVLSVLSEAFGEALLVTNTSALSITDLAEHVRDPSRFLGMHFFNPVPRSLLIELVRAVDTAPSSMDRARAWVNCLGKQSIEVQDAPGFATSRLGIALGLEAIRMVEEGVASAEDIDTGMVLGYRFPMGPLELSDLVGLDVRLAIAEHLHGALGPRFEPPRLLRDKVARGELGKKSGRGFFLWDDSGRRATPPASSPSGGLLR